jgi:hypothetical protein
LLTFNATAWSNSSSLERSISPLPDLESKTVPSTLAQTSPSYNATAAYHEGEGILESLKLNNNSAPHFDGASPEASRCRDEWIPVLPPYNGNWSKVQIAPSPSLITIFPKEVFSRPFTTVCPNYRRYIVPEPEGTESAVFVTETDSWVPNHPRPKCSIGSDDCSRLTTSWESHFATQRSASSSWESFWKKECDELEDRPASCSLRKDAWFLTRPEWEFSDVPGCQERPPLTDCGKCDVGAGVVQMLYFPVSVIGDACGNRSTISASPTGVGPNTAVLNGTTFTSGFVYLSIEEVSAWSHEGYLGFGSSCGPTLTNVLISIPSPDVSSYRKYGSNKLNFGYVPFNFADLANGPPPFSVWEHSRGVRCGPMSNVTSTSDDENISWNYNPEWCSDFIADFEYNPGIVVPTQILSLHSFWTTCKRARWTMQDPPLALTPVSRVLPASITLSSGNDRDRPTPVLPQPGNIFNPPGPTSTIAPHNGPTSNPDPAMVESPGQDFNSPANAAPSDPQQSAEANKNFQGVTELVASVGAIITAGSSPMTVYSENGRVVAGSTTLPFGSTLFISGTMMIAGSQGIVVGENTVHFSNLPEVTNRAGSAEAVIIAGGATVTVRSENGHIIVGTRTLLPGSSVTVNGVVVSAGPPGYVVVGNKTVPFSTGSVNASSGLGVYILSGLGYYEGIAVSLSVHFSASILVVLTISLLLL